MDLNDLTIKQAKEIAAIINGLGGASETKPVPGAGRAVIVRSRDAGVQFGYLDRFEGSTVYLTNARQMWSWIAAEGGTLLDCATHGVKGGKFSTVSPAVIVIGACAIIDCTDKALKTLESAKWA